MRVLVLTLALVGSAVSVSTLTACDPSSGTPDVDTEADTETPAGTWFDTCGAPVCRGYTGPFPGVPLCSDQVPGDTCDDLDVTCDPEDDCDALVICATEDPLASPSGCPRSLAKFKKDIQYLTDSQKADATRWLKETRLATWRYNWEDDAAPGHLGFIIDDQPNSAAVRPDGETVDLYGYTSLAVAALQAQQVELDVLRAEMVQMRVEMAEMRAAQGVNR